MEMERRLYDVYKKMLAARDVSERWIFSPAYEDETAQKERELYGDLKAVFIELEKIVISAREAYDNADNLPSSQCEELIHLIEEFYHRLSVYHNLTEDSEEWGHEWDEVVQNKNGRFTCIFTQEFSDEFYDDFYEYD